MAEEGELVQGAGWGDCILPRPALCSRPEPSVEVQSHFSQSGLGGHLIPSMFPTSSSLTRLNRKASAWTEPGGCTKLTSLSFGRALLGR